jgi:undecaprenyl-diphosphatase
MAAASPPAGTSRPRLAVLATAISMPYKRHMRTHTPFWHFVLGSLPVLALAAALPYAFGGEDALMQSVRIHKNTHEALRLTANVITDWGNPACYVTFLGILVHGVRTKNTDLTRFALTYVAFQLLINLALLNITKMVLGRPRPMTGESVFHMLTLNPHYHSLPSGHTADFTTSALALAFWRRKAWLTLALGMALALMALTRIYLMQHYPSDVFFGWMYGAFTAWAIYAFGLKKETTAHE